jgi:tellurite methyltransferase
MSEHWQKSDERARWNHRYRDADPRPRNISSLLEQSVALLSPTRDGTPTAVDIAGGDGIEACWLADHGFATTLIDVSDVGLDKAMKRAGVNDLQLETLRLDFDVDRFPDRCWDVVHIGHYLNRPLIELLIRRLAKQPGGLLLVAIATVVNLERHQRPSPRFLLETDELAGLVADVAGLEIIRYDEDWRANGQHEAWLVTRGS